MVCRDARSEPFPLMLRCSARNPEPFAYESAFSVRWSIDRQLAGDANLDSDTVAPLVLWGPYLWTQTTPSPDGFAWSCGEVGNDCTHLTTNSASTPWFLRSTGTDGGTDAGSATDAGPGPDGGTDGGTGADAGVTTDGGGQSDGGAGADGGASTDGGATGADGGGDTDPVGCGCRVGSAGGSAVILTLFAILWLGPRKRLGRSS